MGGTPKDTALYKGAVTVWGMRNCDVCNHVWEAADELATPYSWTVRIIICNSKHRL